MSNYKLISKHEEGNTVIYKIEIDKKEWAQAQDKALVEISKQIRLPGFRPGKAPIASIKKQVSESDVINQAINKQINNTVKYFIENNKDEDVISDEPKVDLVSVSPSELLINIKLDKTPEIKIGDYKKFKIELLDDKVSEEEVKHEFNRLIKRDIMLVPTDSAIKSGDNANINFAGKKDGKEFDGGKGEKFDLVIGSGSFIPGFEEQLIGMKAGDEKTIDVTFPKSYPHDELAGKPVQFDVKVNSVSNVEEPEFNKEYFTKFKIAGVESKEQFVEYLKQQIVDWKKQKQLQDFQKHISEELINSSSLSYYPESLIKMEERRVDEQTTQTAQKEGKSKDEYLQSIGYSEEKLYKEGLRKTAERDITLVFAIEKIASELKIEVTEADIDAYFEKIAKLYGMKVEDVKDKYKNNLSGIEAFIYQNKLYEELIKFYK